MLITFILLHLCKNGLLAACGYCCSQILYDAHGLKLGADSAAGGDVANHTSCNGITALNPVFFLKFFTGQRERENKNTKTQIIF